MTEPAAIVSSQERLLTKKNTRQLDLKLELNDRFFARLYDDEEPLSVFDHCWLDDEITSPSDAMDLAAEMLEHVASESLRTICASLMPGMRYSYRKFIDSHAEECCTLCLPSVLKVVKFDPEKFDEHDYSNIRSYLILVAALACNESIATARGKLASGRPMLVDLISIGMNIEAVQAAVSRTHDEAPLEKIRASHQRELDAKKGAAARKRRVSTEDVLKERAQLVQHGMPKRNIVGVLAKRLNVSRPTIEARLKEK